MKKSIIARHASGLNGGQHITSVKSAQADFIVVANINHMTLIQAGAMLWWYCPLENSISCCQISRLSQLLPISAMTETGTRSYWACVLKEECNPGNNWMQAMPSMGLLLAVLNTHANQPGWKANKVNQLMSQ